ncbi:hypothetical protein WS61_17460 [Burkholderia sp. ABCPW 11]|uniref:hypothetical protein n=1 Tax=Burkholderia sp. ABCPW 11 TaxID=1637859 RepID=UPI000758D866|nr:hypothetical protein [Burkholderia sp. ABCPW 11]KVD42977.1 hypothetical protein WS61_17460 [Burkholderia sp. ABCPW 11]
MNRRASHPARRCWTESTRRFDISRRSRDGAAAFTPARGSHRWLAHTTIALRRIRTLDLDIVPSTHGPAIAHDVPHVLAGTIAHYEAAAA